MLGGLAFAFMWIMSGSASDFSIHLFDVGQGDTQLIIFPSGYSILIDCMESDYSNTTATKVAAKIRSLLNTSSVNVAMASHMHMDHIGSPYEGGMWSLIEQQGIHFDVLIDRNAGIWTDKNLDGVCTSSEFKYISMGLTSSLSNDWMCYTLDSKEIHVYPIRKTATLCSETLITPPDMRSSVRITAADGHGALFYDGSPLDTDHTTNQSPANENDYSLGIRLQYGDFSYSTAGDLTGYTEVDSASSYNDVETSVCSRVGSVDVMKVNHHGSAHSTNDLWVATLKPQVSLISVGATNTLGYPDYHTIRKLEDAGSDVYATEQSSSNYDRAVVVNDDIVITTSSDTKTFTVSSGSGTVFKTYTSKGNNTPTCK
eukprot:TRINITY_DN524_c0_g1_i4.p1 TRINITY_DN524_c0_g1~~TRINITY_DN524_c0_g1_i4.p1  ORF type:complete len:388 (-),score=64.98 TRINITY_DN524_c0_g1_i4:158-1270(-)